MIYFLNRQVTQDVRGYLKSSQKCSRFYLTEVLEIFFWYVVDLQHVMNVFLKCIFLHSVMFILEGGPFPVLHYGCLFEVLSIKELVACLERDEG